MLAHVFQRRRHQREWFFFAVFPRTKPADGVFIGRIHHQMKAAETFYRDNAIRVSALVRRVAIASSSTGDHGSCPSSHISICGPHSRTGVRLRMKSAVERIFIFRAALLDTSRNDASSYSRDRKEAFDDREARTAIRAVREWIEITPIRTGSKTSARQSAHVAMSGNTSGAFCFHALRCDEFRNPVKPRWIEERVLETLNRCMSADVSIRRG